MAIFVHYRQYSSHAAIPSHSIEVASLVVHRYSCYYPVLKNVCSMVERPRSLRALVGELRMVTSSLRMGLNHSRPPLAKITYHIFSLPHCKRRQLVKTQSRETYASCAISRLLVPPKARKHRPRFILQRFDDPQQFENVYPLLAAFTELDTNDYGLRSNCQFGRTAGVVMISCDTRALLSTWPLLCAL
jgi:hypothetical protein